MDWKMTLQIAYLVPILCFCWSASALEAVNPISTIPTAVSSQAAWTAFPISKSTSLNTAFEQLATAASTGAESLSATLPAAALSQAAAAASSQALAGLSSSPDPGSEVGILAQIIIAIGVLPIELLIVALVLGVHRLVHRKTSLPPFPVLRTDRTKPSRDSLPYLQPKAELEDEQRRRHELHGEHVVHELEGTDEIFQLPDETDSLVLPLQGRRGVCEMAEEREGGSWETPLQGRYEVVGDDDVKK